LAFTQSTNESLCPTCDGGAKFSMENSTDVQSISEYIIIGVTKAVISGKIKQSYMFVIL
jgi:formylmethanofuran:tetrahydromethanopterin formyltransferase